MLNNFQDLTFRGGTAPSPMESAAGRFTNSNRGKESSWASSKQSIRAKSRGAGSELGYLNNSLRLGKLDSAQNEEETEESNFTVVADFADFSKPTDAGKRSDTKALKIPSINQSKSAAKNVSSAKNHLSKISGKQDSVNPLPGAKANRPIIQSAVNSHVSKYSPPTVPVTSSSAISAAARSTTNTFRSLASNIMSSTHVFSNPTSSKEISNAASEESATNNIGNSGNINTMNTKKIKKNLIPSPLTVNTSTSFQQMPPQQKALDNISDSNGGGYRNFDCNNDGNNIISRCPSQTTPLTFNSIDTTSFGNFYSADENDYNQNSSVESKSNTLAMYSTSLEDLIIPPNHVRHTSDDEGDSEGRPGSVRPQSRKTVDNGITIDSESLAARSPHPRPRFDSLP